MKKSELIQLVREELRGWSPQIGHTKGLTSKTLNSILMKIASGEDWEPDNEVGKKIKEAFSQIEEERPGLWANIRAKRARGEKPAHKNSKAHKDAVAAGKKINKASSNEEVDVDNKITVLSVIDGKRNLDNDQIRQLFDDSTAGTFYIYAVEEGEEEFHKPVSKQDAYKYVDYYNARLKKDYKREEKLGAELGVLGIESELHFHKGEFKTDPSVFSKNENYADGKVDSALKQTFDQLGKQLANSSDEIVQDKNNVNEAVGIVLVAGIALAIPEIVKIIGQVTKTAGKFLGGTGATGDAIIAKAEKMHHLLLRPIEWALTKLGLPKDKAHKAAGIILTTAVAGLMVASGVGAYKAATSGSSALAGLEGALTAVKGGEVTQFVSKALAAI